MKGRVLVEAAFALVFWGHQSQYRLTARYSFLTRILHDGCLEVGDLLAFVLQES